MTVTNEDLAEAAANGDGEAFSLLLSNVYDQIFGLAFRLTRSRSDAEDLTQDICLSLPAKLPGFERRSKFTTWLYRITVNAAIDRRRKAARRADLAQDWGDWEVNRRLGDEEAQKEQAWLTGVLSQLGPGLRDTMALLLEDLTHAEIAEILGVSEGTISWRVSEAKKKLREIRKEEEAI